MKKTVLFGFVTLVLVLLAACSKVQAPPEMGVAATRTEIRSSFGGAIASFNDVEGCITTYVEVYGFEAQTTQPGGGGTGDAEAVIFIDNYNTCTDEPASSLFVYTTDAVLSIDKRLTAATLRVTDEEACLYGYANETSTCGPLELTVSWTGEGKLSWENRRARQKTPSFTYTESFKGISRLADVTGVLNFRGETTDLSAFDGSAGTLQSGENRFVILQK